MRQIVNIQDIPDVISLTDLRYKTSFLLRRLVDEEKPLILMKKSKKIGLILPLANDLGKQKPEDGLKIKTYPMGVPGKIKRRWLYSDYLNKKVK